MGICGRCLLGFSAVLLAIVNGQAKEPKSNQDVEIAVEVKFVSLDESVVKELERNELLSQQSKGKEVFSLDNQQMLRFMAIAQREAHSNVMQEPRLTMRNGQHSVIDTSDKQQFVTRMDIVYRDGQIDYRPKSETIPLGWRIALHPVVSANRRSVRLHFDAKLNELATREAPRFQITTPAPDDKSKTVTHFIERPQITKRSMNRTMVIPDGNTAVLPGWTENCVQATVTRVPVLGELPILGRLFSSVGYDCRKRHLVILVTADIRVLQDEEKHAEDFRTPILAQYREDDPQCSQPPDEARVIRALASTNRLAGIGKESRDKIQIVTEKIEDKVDPPRFFPLVGPAQLHHCHWKCTVYYQDTIKGSTNPKKEVVYIDLDHLHLYPPSETRTEPRP